MARPGLMKHRKFLRLAAALGDAPALARGHLELLWDSAYECGDDFLGDATDVERLAHWNGPAGQLCAALTEAGFIDQTGPTYTVHDLYDHAPDYVRKRMERETARLAKGKNLREMRSEAARKRWEEQSKQQTPTARMQTAPLASRRDAKVRTRAPARARAPAPIQSPSETGADAPAAEKPFELDGDAQPKQRARSEAQKFRDWAEGERKRVTGLVVGPEPDPVALNTWFRDALREVGSLKRLERAFAGFLLKPRDDFWVSRGFPFAGFMADNVWRQYVPPEAA